MVTAPAPVKRTLGRIPLMDLTEDAILGGRVRLKQPRRGYRVNVDTILLAASLMQVRAGDRIVELGCGVGGALIAMAKSFDGAGAVFLGIERECAYANLARENVAQNGLTQTTTILEADGLDSARDVGVFDHVLFNPPYDYEGEGRAPIESRQAAYIADRPIEDWIKLWSNRMAANADFTLIQRARRLPEILAALEGRLGGVQIYPVRPHARAEASRIIVRAKKGSRAPLRLLPGLDLHAIGASEAKYTPEAEAILQGQARIAFV